MAARASARNAPVVILGLLDELSTRLKVKAQSDIKFSDEGTLFGSCQQHRRQLRLSSNT